MFGPEILARSLSKAVRTGSTGELWQYHSRGDRHSKIACWSALFDLMRSCPKLREHIAAGRVGFSLDHEVQEFIHGRKKNLDLVLCVPEEARPIKKPVSFASLVERYSIVLSHSERQELLELPSLMETNVEEVLIAFKVKACMTGHAGAIRRLSDELHSWHATVADMAPKALRAGIVIVNSATEFCSPVGERAVSHRQPHAAKTVVEALSRIPRRTGGYGVGFDSLGVVLVDCKNDGVSSVQWDDKAPAPRSGEEGNYGLELRKLSALYEVCVPVIGSLSFGGVSAS